MRSRCADSRRVRLTHVVRPEAGAEVQPALLVAQVARVEARVQERRVPCKQRRKPDSRALAGEAVMLFASHWHKMRACAHSQALAELENVIELIHARSESAVL